MTGQHSRTRETIASAAQYVLLGGFASTAAGISAQGLVGFARSNMALRGPWPYLLFFALDGAAGVCAVLMVRRAARAEPGLAPQLAVWGLVAASSFFNWTHAPRRPAAPEAFGLMPVIAALLFEFCLREMRLRTAHRADRTLGALRWVRPAERVRVQLSMAADQRVSAEDATSRVRIDAAARRLYHLRALLRGREQAVGPGALTARRIRRAERRAYGALLRAGFTEPLIAFAVLRQVQVMTQTATLARLDYGTADAAQAAIARLVTATPATPPVPDPAHPVIQDATATEIDVEDGTHPASPNGHRLTGTAQPRAVTIAGAEPETSQQEDDPDPGDRDAELVAAARRIVADARNAGTRLSQIALADKLSATVGNPERLLTWLQGSGAGTRAGTLVAPSTPTTVAAPAGQVELDYVGSVDNAAKVVTALHRGQKRLVFCDSRAQVEQLGAALRAREVTTFLSHASLSAEERVRSEQAFAEARDCVIVSTSTLELGIDIGDLDHVIQIDSPSTVASFLQRLGRNRPTFRQPSQLPVPRHQGRFAAPGRGASLPVGPGLGGAGVGPAAASPPGSPAAPGPHPPGTPVRRQALDRPVERAGTLRPVGRAHPAPPDPGRFYRQRWRPVVRRS